MIKFVSDNLRKYSDHYSVLYDLCCIILFLFQSEMLIQIIYQWISTKLTYEHTNWTIPTMF